MTDAKNITSTATNGNGYTSQFSSIPSSNANVLLVKRITEINGDRDKNPNDISFALNQVLDGSNANDDPTVNWPTNFLFGSYNPGRVKPDDIIEYTIYFLNAQGADASNVKICDQIMGVQQFVADAYGVAGSGRDIEYKLGANGVQYLTKASLTSADRAELNPSTSTLPTCPAPTITGAINGTVVLDVTGTGSAGQADLPLLLGATGKGTPTNSYGYFRFKVRVNP